jgi:hypothetical protein
LKSTSGIVFNQVPALYQEHIDIQFGKQGQPLLRAPPWMRQALMMGIDRRAIIKTVYGSMAGNTTSLDSSCTTRATRRTRPTSASGTTTRRRRSPPEEALHGRPELGLTEQQLDVDLLRPAGQVPLHLDGR